MKNILVSPKHAQNRQMEKYLALESHPRQKQKDTSLYNFAPSVVAMLF